MKRLYILFFISSGYLFSQDAINEKIDLSNSFYKNYLETYFMEKNIIATSNDTAIEKPLDGGIILAEMLTLSNERLFSPTVISLCFKTSIYSNFHIIIKDWIRFSKHINQSYHLLSLMLGYYGALDENKKYIGEIAVGLNSIPARPFYLVINVNVYYRVYKNILLSCGIDYLNNSFGMIDKNTDVYIFSLGLGIGTTFLK